MKIPKRLLSLLLSLILILSLCSCTTPYDIVRDIIENDTTTSGGEVQSSPTPDISINNHEGASSSKTDNEDFSTYLDDIFRDEVTSDTITLHYTLKSPEGYGITRGPATFGDFDLASAAMYSNSVNAELSTLRHFDYESLSKDQQITYNILEQYLNLETKCAGLDLYSSIFTGTSSVQSNLPITMAEYQFYEKQDVEDYIALLNALPEYFDKLCEFEKIRSEKGLFMSDTTADSSISQCTDFLSETDTNVLIETFADRINACDFLTDEEKASYITANDTAVKGLVFDAYNSVIDCLTSLKGTGKNNGGLCGFPKGKEYYEYLVSYYTGSSKSVNDIATNIDASIKDAMSDVYTVYDKNPDAYDYYYNEDLNYGSDDPQTILDTLKVSMLDYYPNPPETSYTIKYVHKSLEDSLSPAFYMVPPIDDAVENVIYINQGEKNGASDIYTTLAHEGYPGHLYQTTYYNATKHNPVRDVLSFGGYTEGWATYVELNSYDLVEFPKYDEELSALAKAMDTMNLAISCRIDIGVNYEGWSVEDVSSYLDDSGFDGSFAQDIYDYVVEDPAVYLKYYGGYLEFNELRTKAESELGDKFDLKEFNKALLDAGPCQFDIVGAYVDDYIEKNK